MPNTETAKAGSVGIIRSDEGWIRLGARVYSERRQSWVMPGAVTLIVLGCALELVAWAWSTSWSG